MTTQNEVRESFWNTFPEFKRKGKRVRQNQYPVDVRMSFVGFVDSLARDGKISEALAKRVIL